MELVRKMSKVLKTKNMLTSELSLTNFIPDLEIIAALDARDFGIRTVLCHKFNYCKIKAISHTRILITVGKKLSSNRKNIHRI